MAELYRHTDSDGYAISVYNTPPGYDGIIIDVWPEHDEGRLACVELPGEAGRLLLAALQQHYNEPAAAHRIQPGDDHV